MKFTKKKCHIMKMGKRKNGPCEACKMGGIIIDTVKEKIDLGIIKGDAQTTECHSSTLVRT